MKFVKRYAQTCLTYKYTKRGKAYAMCSKLKKKLNHKKYINKRIFFANCIKYVIYYINELNLIKSNYLLSKFWLYNVIFDLRECLWNVTFA